MRERDHERGKIRFETSRGEIGARGIRIEADRARSI
jgi:hypothetical protein